MELFEQYTDPGAIQRERWTKRIIIGFVFALLMGAFLYWEFKNYSQEREVKRFFEAVQAGDLRRAHEIWKPTANYSFEDFQRDWGARGDYGGVKEFKIVTSRSRGTDVVVTTRVNGNKEVNLWVRRSDNSFAFPPF
jgi:hypothetical protein